MNPKFQIGESVILQSLSFPELNGDCVVISVHLNPTGLGINHLTGSVHPVSKYSYILSTKSPIDSRWCEVAIKKKYDSSTDSFYEIMRQLKSKNTVK